jgi:SnoaL-like domain
MADSYLSLDERVARLEHTEAIKRLQAQYAAVCDDHYNPDRIIELFTEDGVWDGTAVGLARVEGREALRAYFATMGDYIKWSFHMMIGPDITVATDGQSAHGSWYLLEPASLAESGRPQAVWLGSAYDITYANIGGRWLFKVIVTASRLWAPHATGWNEEGK